MTQSEIDAAAERLEKYYGVVVEPTGNIRACGNDVLEAMEVLAMAYLSDRAARLAQEREDAEPITIERLRAIGFSDETINGVSMLIDSGIGDPVELYLQIELSGHWEATLCQSNRNDMVAITGCHYETIGDVRRLIEALKGTP